MPTLMAPQAMPAQGEGEPSMASSPSEAQHQPTWCASFFAATLVAWQRAHGRKGLPWQNTTDAYRIWVSEIMLQQTQVATVTGYYLRFLDRFPTVETLASASLDEVLAQWSGLGYYRRARLLHACAIAVCRQHDGRFPQEPEVLQRLPGIGRSTAAAIAVFSFQRRAAILDANVRRVLSRFFALEHPTGGTRMEKQLWALAESLVPEASDAAIYTQALMDLGATCCVARQPQCSHCPLAQACRARAAGDPSRYPKARVRPPLPHRTWDFLLVRMHDLILLRRRPDHGVWPAMWCLPELHPEVSATQATDAAGCDIQAHPAQRRGRRHRLAEPTATGDPLAGARPAVCEWLFRAGLIDASDAAFGLDQWTTIDQSFTHFHLRARVWRVELIAVTPGQGVLAAAPQGCRWVRSQEALGMGIPAAMRRLLQGLDRGG